jgi:type IV secretion system protein VirB1
MADALTLAIVLALASQCAPSLDQNLIAGIAKHESGLNPLVLHDNTASRSYAPETVSEARALAADLIHVQGHSVDLGLMQINSRNLAYLGLAESEAFDACHSIEAAATLFRAISYYNTGSPTRGLAPCTDPSSPPGCGYTPSTITSIQQVKALATMTVSELAPPARAPACAAPPWDVWGQQACRDDLKRSNQGEGHD